MYFHSKMAWPPRTYDIISRNHRNWPLLNLTQNAREGWTNSCWKNRVLITMFCPLGENSELTFDSEDDYRTGLWNVRQYQPLGNLRTTTTTLSTTTGSEIPCTAQARLANFVVVVSSTTPNTVESRRPAVHKLRQVFNRFFKGFVFFHLVNQGILSFFS